jgi:2-oxoglutarate ferredoxin oxidoreductase subunit gamma
MMLNIAMVGFFGAVTGLVSEDALTAAVLDSVPPHTRDANLKAFGAGYEFGKALVAGESVPTPVHA